MGAIVTMDDINVIRNGVDQMVSELYDRIVDDVSDMQGLERQRAIRRAIAEVGLYFRHHPETALFCDFLSVRLERMARERQDLP